MYVLVVPPPDASKPSTSFHDLCSESFFTKLVEKIDAREASSDDHGIEIVMLGCSVCFGVTVDAVGLFAFVDRSLHGRWNLRSSRWV